METVLPITNNFNIKVFNFGDLTCLCFEDRMILNYDQWTEFYKNTKAINDEMHDHFTSQYPKNDKVG